MNTLYRIALSLLLSIGFTGCEALAPNGQPKPKPIVTPDTLPQRVEIVVKVDGDGRIQLVGNSEIKLSNAQTSAQRCECGCGKDGCACNQTQDLASKSVSMTPPDANRDRHAGEISLKTSRDIVVVSPASFRCPACELAEASIKALGFDVIVEKRDGLSSYPQVRNRRGVIATGLMSDGYWRQGRDDVEAVKQLAK